MTLKKQIIFFVTFFVCIAISTGIGTYTVGHQSITVEEIFKIQPFDYFIVAGVVTGAILGLILAEIYGEEKDE